MIHFAVTGSRDRVTAVLLEHVKGRLPLWLAPVQVTILPVGETHHDFAKQVVEKLHTANIRAKMDDSGESLGKKVRMAKLEKVPAWLVIGDKEIAAQGATLEFRDTGSRGALPVDEVVSILRADIEARR